MNFLEKLNYLMERDKLNKNTLSKACNIPYTTIDGWYKKGYEGLKLSTLRKLADFFGTTLDFWALDETNDKDEQLLKRYNMLSNEDRELVKNMIISLSEKSEIQISRHKRLSAYNEVLKIKKDNKTKEGE